MQAAIITTAGSVTYRDVTDLADMQAIVGGPIEAVTLRDGSVMFVNEDGHRLGLGPNPVAVDVCLFGGRVDVGLVLGDVLIVGPTDYDGECTDLTVTARRWVQRVVGPEISGDCLTPGCNQPIEVGGRCIKHARYLDDDH